MSLLQILDSEKIVAILRHVPVDKIKSTVQSLSKGGIKLIEVTMNSERASHSIHQLRNHNNELDLVIGAGTVLNIEMAKEAVDAGSQFLISPNLDLKVVEYAIGKGVDIWPGVMTPTEIANAWNAGATAIKLFPASTLGPEYIRDIKAPLDNIPVIATGGITLENQQAFLNAGAVAVGLGSQLVNQEMIFDNRFEELQNLAKQFVDNLNREVV